jgi:hypothetical protein
MDSGPACWRTHPGMTTDASARLLRYIHLFRKFNGKPPRGQSMAISSPLPDSVM